MKKIIQLIGTGLLTFMLVGVAFADNIYNGLDATIDATLEDMNLTVGGPTGTATFYVQVLNGDGKSGCNISGPGSPALVVNVVTSDEDVATVNPTTLNFGSCGDTEPITVTSVGEGEATISLAEVSNTTLGSFNLAPASFKVTVDDPAPSDDTPPVITYGITPEPNDNEWNNSPVTVVWDVNDGESDITDMSGCDEVTLDEETDTDGVELTCTATSEGGESSESVTIKIDMTAPVIEGAPDREPDSNGWYNDDVEVEFSCTDTLSGVDSELTTLAGDTLTEDGVDQSVTSTGDCIDEAGNIADPSTATVSGIDIDKTAPEVTITTPADDSVYTYNQSVLANWTATDGGSGIDVVTPTTANGAAISTTPVGAKAYTVTATDLAGNSTTVTNNYSVVPYTFAGCKPPLTLNSKDFKLMSSIPVKCVFNTNTGSPVSVATIRLSVDGNPAIASGSSNTSNYFRFSPTDGQWIYNLSTKQLGKGNHTLTVTTDDGAAPHTYPIVVK